MSKNMFIYSVGKHTNVPDKAFDKEQLKKGMKVELEHTDNVEVAKAISKDHLSEHPKYYDYLEEAEKKMEADLKKK